MSIITSRGRSWKILFYYCQRFRDNSDKLLSLIEKVCVKIKIIINIFVMFQLTLKGGCVYVQCDFLFVSKKKKNFRLYIFNQIGLVLEQLTRIVSWTIHSNIYNRMSVIYCWVYICILKIKIKMKQKKKIYKSRVR